MPYKPRPHSADASEGTPLPTVCVTNKWSPSNKPRMHMNNLSASIKIRLMFVSQDVLSLLHSELSNEKQRYTAANLIVQWHVTIHVEWANQISFYSCVPPPLDLTQLTNSAATYLLQNIKLSFKDVSLDLPHRGKHKHGLFFHLASGEREILAHLSFNLAVFQCTVQPNTTDKMMMMMMMMCQWLRTETSSQISCHFIHIHDPFVLQCVNSFHDILKLGQCVYSSIVPEWHYTEWMRGLLSPKCKQTGTTDLFAQLCAF